MKTKINKLEIKSKILHEYINFYDKTISRCVEVQLKSSLEDISKKIKSYHSISNAVGTFKDLYNFFEDKFNTEFYSRFDKDFFNNTNEQNIGLKINEIEKFIENIKTIENFEGEIIIFSKIESDSKTRGFIEKIFENKSLKKIRFKKDFSIDVSFLGSSISNIEVNGIFEVKNIKGVLDISDSIFTGGINIQNTNLESKVIFSNNIFKKILDKKKNFFHVNNIKLKEISIIGGRIEGILKLEKIESEKIKILSVNIEGKKQGKILFSRLKNTSEITVGGTNKNSKFEILEFSKVFNTKGEGLLLLYNLDVDNFLYHGSTIIPKVSISGAKFLKLEFSEVDLGKSMFNNLEIDKIYLDGANLSECIFNDIDFKGNYNLEPNPIERIEGNKIGSSIGYGKLKDNYRQLKHVMDKNGNHTEANKFFAKEMEYHGKTLTKMSDKILFWLGKNISDFGNDWVRVIIILIGITFISVFINFIYIMFFYELPNGFFSPTYNDYIRVFINLIYPLHGLRKEYIESLDNWLLLGFITYKFIYAYLAYSLIVAFKRTTKR